MPVLGSGRSTDVAVHVSPPRVALAVSVSHLQPSGLLAAAHRGKRGPAALTWCLLLRWCLSDWRMQVAWPGHLGGPFKISADLEPDLDLDACLVLDLIRASCVHMTMN